MTPKYIILHHSLTKDSGTVSAGAIRRYHTETLGWADVGYHFLLEDIAGRVEILVGRLWDEQGAHCKARNRDSLGICLVGNFDLAPPPPEMWATGVRLVRALCVGLRIDPANIHGHRDYDPKTCPGTHFDLAKFRADVVNWFPKPI